MEAVLKILNKIENPLIFLSRDSYKNLPIVKDLERTMSGFLDELMVAFTKDSLPQPDETIAELQKVFQGFDALPVADRKRRIDAALVYIRELKNLRADPAPPPPATTLALHEPEDRAACLKKLALDVQYIKGVGPKVSALLGRKGLKNVEDMLYFLPRRYEDRRQIQPISSVAVGARETVVGTVTDVIVRRYRSRRVLEVTIGDNTSLLTAKWFQGNFSYLAKRFKEGQQVILTGEVKVFLYGKEMLHPDYEVLDEADDEMIHFKRIVPVYSETEGLHPEHMAGQGMVQGMGERQGKHGSSFKGGVRTA